MNNFVKSGPAADLRALERVLMISPLGSTTVWRTRIKPLRRGPMRASYDVEEPFSSCGSIPNRIRYGNRLTKAKLGAKRWDRLPDPPVLTIPPIVAPGPGSSYTIKQYLRGQIVTALTGKKRGIPAHQVSVREIANAARTDLSLLASRLHPSTELLLDRRDPNLPLARMISSYTG